MDMPESRFVLVDGLRIHYLEAGAGDPVVLLHGWPTSSLLWRNVLPAIAAAGRRAIAPDLLGFGRSDKPLDVAYTYDYHAGVLDGFLEVLGIERTALGVHDLGGPVGLLWATRNPERVDRLAILDTVFSADSGLLMRAFVGLMRLPGIGMAWTSRAGLTLTLRTAPGRPRLPKEVLAAYTEPFAGTEARRALAKNLVALPERGAIDVSRLAATPTLILWGNKDFLFRTALSRFRRAFPDARVIVLKECMHFLPEDAPDRVSAILADFFRVEPGTTRGA